MMPRVAASIRSTAPPHAVRRLAVALEQTRGVLLRLEQFTSQQMQMTLVPGDYLSQISVDEAPAPASEGDEGQVNSLGGNARLRLAEHGDGGLPGGGQIGHPDRFVSQLDAEDAVGGAVVIGAWCWPSMSRCRQAFENACSATDSVALWPGPAASMSSASSIVRWKCSGPGAM